MAAPRFQETPVASAVVAVALFIHVASYLGSGAARLFALNPSRTITVNFYVWNVVTGSLIESNVVKAAGTLAALFWAASKLERAWGGKAVANERTYCIDISAILAP